MSCTTIDPNTHMLKSVVDGIYNAGLTSTAVKVSKLIVHLEVLFASMEPCEVSAKTDVMFGM